MDSVKLTGSEDSVFPFHSRGIDPGDAPVGPSRDHVLQAAEGMSGSHGVSFCPENTGPVMVSPFVRMFGYIGGPLTPSMNGQDMIFPTPSSPNTVICIGSDDVVIVSDCRVLSSCLQDCICLPSRVYDVSKMSSFSSMSKGLACCIEGDYIIPHSDGIGAVAFSEFRDRYVGRPRVSRDDVFRYVLAMLCLGQRESIPLVRSSADFWGLVDAGDDVLKLHLSRVHRSPETIIRRTRAITDRLAGTIRQ